MKTKLHDEQLWKGVPAGVPCWHIHHDCLLEMSTEPLSARAEFIVQNKPTHEHATRLRLMRPVIGELPDVWREAAAAADAAWRKAKAAAAAAAAAWRKLDEADAAWRKAKAAADAANAAWRKADDAARRKAAAADAAWRKAKAAADAANAAWRKADDAARRKAAAADAAAAAWRKLDEADAANAAWRKAKAAAAWRKAKAADAEPDIEALHRLECPNCPWDGKTIFPERKEP